MYLLAIYNPVAGNSAARSVYEEHVYPLLAAHNHKVVQKVETQRALHAADIVAQLVASRVDSDEISVILGSGDGTLHEIINSFDVDNTDGAPIVSFILIPCGTANALFNSLFPSASPISHTQNLLHSLNAFVGLTKPHRRPLTLARTVLSRSHDSVPSAQNSSLSAIVISTALHASILHDSESLRQEMPGIERFKVAAQKNSTRWYQASAKFAPAPKAGTVQVYDPDLKAFKPHPEADKDAEVHLSGPFVYFLSTVNVDRLEPAFRISPLSSTMPATEPVLDVIIVRPLRDPSIASEGPDARSAFVPKLWKVLGGAYEDGAHVNMRYNSMGEVDVGHDGEAVVEYIRCGGWEWTPDESDVKAGLVCADGDISAIDKGGKASCSICEPSWNERFFVYT
ncbi:hypothetical protein HGRIS_013344 [Hohenbuehelia grisea]|uniref:DAGKc domain-containing protein n=1 Tax=Hohenbuehelia grisea TaxID=104357 RepID=A0ABR3IVA2_9AGAR